MYLPADSADNDVCPIRRDYPLPSRSITSAGFCSTPNARVLKDIHFLHSNETNNYPMNNQQFQTAPFTTGSYFLAHNSSQNLNFDQPKIIFNTVIGNAGCQKIELGIQNQQAECQLAGHNVVETVEERPAESKQTSDFSRGHRTITSLLNSLPLNLVELENGIAQKTKANGDFAPSINISSVDLAASKIISSEKESSKSVTDTTNVFETGDKVKPVEITNGSKDKDKGSAKYQNVSDSEAELDDKDEYICNQKHKCDLNDKCDSQETQNVDRNNNFQLVQKYSDISDACASDTETTTDTSSSEEEHFENREINKKPMTKVKTRRKPQYPRRSAVKEDPRFKGVTVWLQTSFRRGQSSLQISAFYSNVKEMSPGRITPAFQRRCSTPRARCFSFSDQEGNSPAYIARDNHVTVKTCASCKTRRTPLWRDADDGTPLCNACGIRYKKYRLRCSKCWHIPRKEVKTYPNCPVCGASLRYSFHKKTW